MSGPGGVRSSLDRVLAASPGEPLWKLKQRALAERGIAVIDLGQVRNGDFLFGKWAREEATRQANDEKRRG
jgi:hypothetical protein